MHFGPNITGQKFMRSAKLLSQASMVILSKVNPTIFLWGWVKLSTFFGQKGRLSVCVCSLVIG